MERLYKDFGVSGYHEIRCAPQGRNRQRPVGALENRRGATA